MVGRTGTGSPWAMVPTRGDCLSRGRHGPGAAGCEVPEGHEAARVAPLKTPPVIDPNNSIGISVHAVTAIS